MRRIKTQSFGSTAYGLLSEFDSDCWEYIGRLGKKKTGILELYMLAFELAQKQLRKEKDNGRVEKENGRVQN